ncbi:hypothetical protein Tco_1087279 [Tanacetum coccineum]
MGRTKTKFDNLILDIASLESEEIVGSDLCIWNLSNDDTFSVNKVRKHIEECSLPMLPNRLNLSSQGLDLDSISCMVCNILLNQIRIPFSLVIRLLLFGGLFDLGLVFRSQSPARVKTGLLGFFWILNFGLDLRMESSAVARYIPRKSLKRVFPGSSSSAMEPEVIEISDYPVESGDRTPKSVSRSKDKGKQKELSENGKFAQRSGSQVFRMNKLWGGYW